MLDNKAGNSVADSESPQKPVWIRPAKWLGSVAAILLAEKLLDALVSGPLGSLRDAALNVLSLGLQSIKDYSYREIAQGFHEQNSTFGLGIIANVVCVVSVLYVLDLFIKVRRLGNENRKIAARAAALNPMGSNQAEVPKIDETSVVKRVKKLQSDVAGQTRSLKKIRVLAYTALCLTVIYAAALESDYLRSVYVSSAVTHFHQVLAIARPYLAEGREAQILSKFAQIAVKDDYVAVVKELEEAAKKNNAKIPMFDPW